MVSSGAAKTALRPDAAVLLEQRVARRCHDVHHLSLGECAKLRVHLGSQLRVC